jgi:hypothetical protein
LRRLQRASVGLIRPPTGGKVLTAVTFLQRSDAALRRVPNRLATVTQQTYSARSGA